MTHKYFYKFIITLIALQLSNNAFVKAQTIPTSFTRTENDIYRQDANGNWVKIDRGEVTYSPTQVTIDGENATGYVDGSDVAAGNLNLTTTITGDTQMEASQLSVNNNNGSIYTADQASISGENGTIKSEVTNGSGTNGTYTANGNHLSFETTVDEAKVNGTGVGVSDANGNALSFGNVTAIRNANTTTIDGTNVTGTDGTNTVTANQLSYENSLGVTTMSGEGVNANDGSGISLTFGTINSVNDSNGTFIEATDGSATISGFNIDANTVNLEDSNGEVKLGGTGVNATDTSNGNNLSFGTLGATQNADGTNFNGTNTSATFGTLNATANTVSGNMTPEQTQLRATDVNTTTPSGNSLSFGAIEGVQNADGTTIDASNISGHYDGVIGTAETLRYQESTGNGQTTISGTNAEIIETNGRGDPRVQLDNFRATTHTGRSGTDINVNGTFQRTTGAQPLSFGLEANQLEGATYERSENGGTFNIQTGDEGGISSASVKLGDSVSFHAIDSDGNANQLTVSYHLDAEAGKFSMEVVYQNGDQVEIKVLPFTFTSEQALNETAARLQLSASTNPQDIQAYLATITGLNNFDYVSDFLSVGNGKLRVRVGGATGVEMIYSNPGHLTGTSIDNPHDERLALGLGMFNRGQDGSESTLGLLLSADSSLSYEIGSGSLSVAGIPIPDRGEIPLTLGLYASHTYTNGTTVFGHLGASVKNFEEVSYSAAIGVSTQIGENTTFDVGASGNTEGDYALSAVFGVEFGARSSGITDAQREANRNMSSEERKRILTRPVRGLSN